jgi:DUF438 domain-containing protein
MDAIAMLRSQHEETVKLLDALVNARSEEDRRHCLMAAARMLTQHAILEETHFYNSICQRGLEGLTHEARHDHEEVRYLLDELANVECSDPRFTSLANDLSQRVKDHIAQEEQVLFPAAMERCDVKALSEIGDAMVFSARVWDANENPDPLAAAEGPR